MRCTDLHGLTVLRHLVFVLAYCVCGRFPFRFRSQRVHLALNHVHRLKRQAMELPVHYETDRQLSISELQGDPLHYVMEFLDTKTLCSAVQVRILGQRCTVACLHTCVTVLLFAGLQKLARCRFAGLFFPYASLYVQRFIRPHRAADRT